MTCVLHEFRMFHFRGCHKKTSPLPVFPRSFPKLKGTDLSQCVIDGIEGRAKDSSLT